MLYLLPQAIDRAAFLAPEREAVRCSGSSLTYSSLAERSDRLAGVLREYGVRRGDRVGIHAGKGLESAVAIHGIMKAGAAYVPLDPDAPPKRLGFMIRDGGIRHLVSEPSRVSTLAGLVAGGLELRLVVGVATLGTSAVPSVTWDDVETAPGAPFPGDLTDEDLAYVLYTSGSTGVPKGVMHTHRSALAFAEVAAESYGLTGEDRLSNHAPLHFDLSTLDYFAGAVAGATTVIIPEAYTKLPASLSQLIERERLTVLYAVPLALTQLLLHGALGQRDLSSLRWVLFGGEPFPNKHLRALMARIPSARFSNVYGPTEVNGVTYWILPEPPGEADPPIPIGRPYRGVEAVVVDGDDRAVEAGEPGELLVRTPTMMRGYWGRPDLDAGAFCERPRADGETGVFHRTGDLVERREDGVFLFLGRKDRQIKARGYRVELDEVEAVLVSHEAVESGAVFAVPDPSGTQRIEAAVLPNGRSVEPRELALHLAESLPPYALPERIEVLDSLPRTSSGKIDRLKLSERARERADERSTGSGDVESPSARTGGGP